MSKFRSGNVIRDYKGDLYVVVGDGAKGSTHALFFNSSNSSIHIPKKDLYETEWEECEETGQSYPEERLIAHGIKHYTLAAHTIDDFITNNLRDMMGLGSKPFR